MKYMLDTNICIYIIKKKPTSVIEQLHTKMNDGIAISSITLAELEYGVAMSEHKKKFGFPGAVFSVAIHIAL